MFLFQAYGNSLNEMSCLRIFNKKLKASQKNLGLLGSVLDTRTKRAVLLLPQGVRRCLPLSDLWVLSIAGGESAHLRLTGGVAGFFAVRELGLWRHCSSPRIRSRQRLTLPTETLGSHVG